MNLDLGEMSDAMLLRSIGDDPRSLEEFYRRHVGTVTRFLARRCSDPEDVADAVSVTFLSVLTSFDTYDPNRGTTTGWVLSIAANAAKQQWRSDARDQRILDRVRGSRLVDADDLERLAEMIDAEKGTMSVIRALTDAPAVERELLAYMITEDVGPAEAARDLGISHGAARTRLTRLRRRVRRQLDEDGLDAAIDSSDPASGQNREEER